MADRIFGCIALAITIAYGFIAFTIIEAPFQYDPLGPEAWPRILSVVAGLCCLYIVVRPESAGFRIRTDTLLRIAVVIVLLGAYARLFEPLGFILSTVLFCGILSAMLGASAVRAALFGIASGVIGYLLCSSLLDLNLPGGLLSKLLRRML